MRVMREGSSRYHEALPSLAGGRGGIMGNARAARMPHFAWLVILPPLLSLFTSSSQSGQWAKVRYATSTGGASQRRDRSTADVDPLERDPAMIQNGGGGTALGAGPLAYQALEAAR
jgi:hypothetical protein